MSSDTLNIYDYNDYREYLSDFYQTKKSRYPGYSHRVFAKSAGLSSPSHLSMIIKGERNLSLKTMAKFAEGLKLTSKERKYFERLVAYNQATDLQEKAKAFSEILALKSSLRSLNQIEKDKFEFLAKWYAVAIYVMVDMPAFQNNPKWICQTLKESITPTQAKDTLAGLLRLGLIKKNDDGTLEQSSGAVTIPDDTKTLAVFRYHSSMIRLGENALRNERQDLREMNGVTFAIPAAKLGEFKQKIRAFRKEMNQLASDMKDPDQIYQMNIQLFPLSEVLKDDDK